jgi:hypothetical protein
MDGVRCLNGAATCNRDYLEFAGGLRTQQQTRDLLRQRCVGGIIERCCKAESAA